MWTPNTPPPRTGGLKSFDGGTFAPHSPVVLPFTPPGLRGAGMEESGMDGPGADGAVLP
jgi:hypothetical protein